VESGFWELVIFELGVLFAELIIGVCMVGLCSSSSAGPMIS